MLRQKLKTKCQFNHESKNKERNFYKTQQGRRTKFKPQTMSIRKRQVAVLHEQIKKEESGMGIDRLKVKEWD